ncbi:MAG: hypothetical protein E7486_04670 [Ruminococcaceae bacterium]|nr:hypothetical protein [Oscillospiraceae bacterium]
MMKRAMWTVCLAAMLAGWISGCAGETIEVVSGTVPPASFPAGPSYGTSSQEIASNGGDVSSLATSSTVSPSVSYPAEFPSVSSGTGMTGSVPAVSGTPVTGSGASSRPAVSSQGSSSSAPAQTSPRTNYANMKAVWFSYLDLEEGFTSSKTAAQFREHMGNVLENLKTGFGINTFIFQVRMFGDAMYPSKYFCWSFYANENHQDPGYDPLQIVVEECHKRQISIHAWVNPYRGFKTAKVPDVSADYAFTKWLSDSSKKGDYLVQFGEYWYFNPGVAEVAALIADGVAEICENYEVDGIHFDDYFYPNNADNTFDQKAYNRYLSGIGGGTALSRSAWRMDNVNRMVWTVYRRIKSINPNILFGISPQGNVENCEALGADVTKWVQNAGYVDYMIPQLYYATNSDGQGFSHWLDTWNGMVTQSGIRLYAGLALYKEQEAHINHWHDPYACADRFSCTSNLICNGYDWLKTTNNLAAQYRLALGKNRVQGVALYRYGNLFPGNSTAQGYQEYRAELSALAAELKK